MDRLRCTIYFLFILLIVLVNVSTYAATIHVPKDELTIQSGIDAAADGDTVLVADGIYKDDGNVNIDFKGKQIIVKSENGPKSTIITCSYTPYTRGFSFSNKETVDAVLEGFTIRNGRYPNGGGIYILNSSPTIRNCVIEWNRAVDEGRSTGQGGGIYAKNSNVLIIECTIRNNQAESTYGGGIFFEGDKEDLDFFPNRIYQPSISKSVIVQNTGSGIHSIEYIQTHIKKSEISRNTLRGIVATSFQRGGTLISDCVISQNTGGGVECGEFSILKIQNTIIQQNTGNIGGGISGGPSAEIEAINCVIAQNIAQRWGGGIGITSKMGGSSISNCTVTRNVSEQQGGGVYVSSAGAPFIMSKSIVWGNSSNGTHDEVFVSGPNITIKNSDIKDGLDGIGREPDGRLFIYEDNIDSNPLFVDPDRNDFRLRRDSDAAGMGANALSQNPLSVSFLEKKWLKWGELKLKTH